MVDIIRLLPEGVANQIAAGEVIQRPASAVKELMENSIDAGALDIQVIIKDAGRTLIQVIDNGCGMSPTDVRMSIERHATSKIRDSKDLFAIRTMGFRGEAMASIVAVAQVEIKSKRHEDEIGTCLEIYGSVVKNQSPCACTNGTSISVKNLFYNVPARRKFLKTDAVEIRNIIDEFQRIAIMHPEITFTLHHNNKILFQLLPFNLKNRIVHIFGSNYSDRLVPVEETTDIVRISGYIGKPQFARKTRGEQFFFANKRFIRHPYLHHAIEEAYTELIPDDSFPSYFINFEVDPTNIDVNIHPTKIEVNFLHQQVIYAILRAAIKKALGIYNLAPTIDFETEPGFEIPPLAPGQTVKPPVIRINPDYNPFDRLPSGSGTPPGKDTSGWEKLYYIPEIDSIKGTKDEQLIDVPEEHFQGEKQFLQVSNRFIVAGVKSGILLIDQQAAHERILYERFMTMLSKQVASSQRLLYPFTLKFSPQDDEIISNLLPEIRKVGFEISEFGRNTYIIDGVPTGMEDQNIEELIEMVLENFKKNKSDLALDKKINFARSISGQLAVRPGRKLFEKEMNNLVDELFRCQVAGTAPDGRKIFIIVTSEELEKKLR
jgi:DNA mismatch repair protein MutL